MTHEAKLFATIEQHIEGRAKECLRIRRRLDYRARRRLIRQRWCKATGLTEAEYANAAAEWNAARIQAAMARR